MKTETYLVTGRTRYYFPEKEGYFALAMPFGAGWELFFQEGDNSPIPECVAEFFSLADIGEYLNR